jgi:hypothetical protein
LRALIFLIQLFPRISKAQVRANGHDKANQQGSGLEPHARFNDQRKSAGGPREGSGGAVMAAMCAAGIGCMAWAKGKGCVNDVLIAGGGALMEAHKGQSSVWLDADASSSPCTTSFMLPVLEQTKSMPCGLTMGDAIATPTDNANHTSTRRVRWMA